MEIVERLIEGIKAHGACNAFKGGTLEELIEELFSPQGVEFVLKTGFPGLYEFREIQKTIDLKPYGVFVDSGDIELTEQRRVCLVGKTSAMLNYSEIASNKIVMLSGAKAFISASGFAVVKVEKGFDSIIDSKASEKAVILW